MFELKPLPFAYDALEPFMDKETVEIHHDRHHKTYVDKLNAALEGSPDLQKKTVEELVRSWQGLPDKVKTAVRNHAGGTWNHDFFWQVLKKGTKPNGRLLEAINKSYGSFDNFKKEFTAQALALFGSGWTWLVVKDGKLSIMNTPNQECPITEGFSPVLVIDVWEHAYYLKHRNKRADFVEDFFNIINWDSAEELYRQANV
jgi:superoxide dismutase, Fe-Mn family